MGLKRAARRHTAKNQGGQEKEKATQIATTNIETAVAMRQASGVLKKEFDKGRSGTEEERARVGGPFLAESILAAFGIENALKALIRREGKNPENIHNLKKLYDKLAPETQQRICEKGATISIPANGKVMGIRVEGVIDEHQDSFQELRYRESGKGLPVIPGLLTSTLWAIIETHQEKYGEEVKREEERRTQEPSPGIPERLEAYLEKVFIQKSG